MDQIPAKQRTDATLHVVKEERRPKCETCWMGEYKETGYRYCMNPKCPQKPGTRK